MAVFCGFAENLRLAMNQTGLRRFRGSRIAIGWRSLHSVKLTVAILLVAFFTHPVFAQDNLATEPLLRLNTDRHTAPIWSIATDAQNRFVVTASGDKTARVWSLPNGKLQAVLRVPIGDGRAGRLFAVALTPDGSTVALGGWTGPEGARAHNIYLFNRASGH
jgi:WD40 repeat protein